MTRKELKRLSIIGYCTAVIFGLIIMLDGSLEYFSIKGVLADFVKGGIKGLSFGVLLALSGTLWEISKELIEE